MLDTNGKRVRFLFNLMRPAEYGEWIKKQEEFASCGEGRGERALDMTPIGRAE